MGYNQVGRQAGWGEGVERAGAKTGGGGSKIGFCLDVIDRKEGKKGERKEEEEEEHGFLRRVEEEEEGEPK